MTDTGVVSRAPTPTPTTTPGTPPPRERLRAVDLLIFDFDGVMTDNRVLVMQDGAEGVLCNRSDGLGVGMLRDAGLDMLVLSAETNPVVSRRCEKLRIPCIQGFKDKLAALDAELARRALDPARIAYVGNDLNDLPCMARAGLAIAVADAYPPVLAAAAAVTRATGGHGAVREVTDWFIAARGPTP